MREGWKCPNCGKAHGPHIDTCPEQASAAPFQPVPGTYIPPTTITLPYVVPASPAPHLVDIPAWWQTPVTAVTFPPRPVQGYN